MAPFVNQKTGISKKSWGASLRCVNYTKFTRSTYYPAIDGGKFPNPVSLTDGRLVAWGSEEIDEWIDARIANRDGGPMK